MGHKFDPREIAKLENPERKQFMPPEQVLAPMGLAPRMRVADVGCGTGYFTAPMAKAVAPEGRVFAIDIAREMLDRAVNNLRLADITNVEFIQSTENNIPLPDGSADAALLANTLHEAEKPVELLREILRIITTGSQLLVVEWIPEETPKGPPVGDRISPEQVIALAKQAGFGNGVVTPVGPYHYGVRVEKL